MTKAIFNWELWDLAGNKILLPYIKNFPNLLNVILPASK